MLDGRLGRLHAPKDRMLVHAHRKVEQRRVAGLQQRLQQPRHLIVRALESVLAGQQRPRQPGGQRHGSQPAQKGAPR